MAAGGATDNALEKCTACVNGLHTLRDEFNDLFVEVGNLMGPDRWTGNKAFTFHEAWDGTTRTNMDQNLGVTLAKEVKNAAQIAANILKDDDKDYGNLENEIAVEALSSSPPPDTNPTFATDEVLQEAQAIHGRIETDVFGALDTFIATGDDAAAELWGGDKQTFLTAWRSVEDEINATLKPALDEIASQIETAISGIETASGGFA